MATTLNAGTTTATSLQITPDTTGAMNIQSSGTTAIAISSSQVVTLTNPLLPASGGTGVNALGTGVATALGQAVTGSGGIVLGASPTLTGAPVAPTATSGTNTTQLATTAFVQTAIATAVVSGSLMMWPTATAPTGYLLCNGAAVSRTTYATLFGVVGTTFGSGDGSTTFNLPNYQDKMPIGVNSIASTIGATGGSSTTTLTTSNLPSHTHTATVTDPGHSHTIPGNFATFGGGSSSGANNTFGMATATNSSTTGITVTNSSTGSGTAATTISPYLGINFIIKT